MRQASLPDRELRDADRAAGAVASMSLSGHLWTVAPSLQGAWRPAAAPAARRWTGVVEDVRAGSVMLSGWLREPPGASELLVAVHGLGSGANSPVMRAAAVAAEAAGIASLRLNLRGADENPVDIHHGGLTDDLHAALESQELEGYRRLYLLGYSLGGHIALRLATEEADPRLAAVAAVCAPLDLALSAGAIDSPGAWIYRRYLLASLKRIYATIAARHPPEAPGRPGLPEGLLPLPVAAVARLSRLRDFDDAVVAPRYGFAGVADYYARASAGPLLPRLRLPTLLVNSEHDPMVPAATIHPSLAAPTPRLDMRWIDSGGHCALPRHLDLGLPGEKGLEAQAIAWLRQVRAAAG
jgi:predicted alpha/beta-fold hydrolase